MRKFFRMYLTLALVMLGVMSVNAADRIPVDAEHFAFRNYDGWDANAAFKSVATGENGQFLIDQANGCPIGDTNCNAWIDLGYYSKLYVKMTGCDGGGNPDGSNPRIFINRLETEGQFNADENSSKCLVISKTNENTWAKNYFTIEADGTFVIDLVKIKKKFGFVHFHSIKGSAWDTKAMVSSIEVEMAIPGQLPTGWYNLVNNSDMEDNVNISFKTKIWEDETGNDSPIFNSEIVDGVGVDGSRAVVVATKDKVANSYDNQFWIYLNEPLPEGTKYRVSFDYRAEHDANIEMQAHAEPGNYNHYEMFTGVSNFTTGWQHYEVGFEGGKEPAITAQQAGTADGKYFRSIAFNLNASPEANKYYFDNIKFEVYKAGTQAVFDMDVIKIDFASTGEEGGQENNQTNLVDLVKACGKRRLVFPEGTATVKVNGEDCAIASVEGADDGRFFIFLDESLNEDDMVEVTYTNSADPAYRLMYTDGSKAGQEVSYNEMAVPGNVYSGKDVLPYDGMVPVIEKTEPEKGSFNLPNNIAEFKITFDKNVDCAALKATLDNNETLTVTPAEGFAETVVLTRGDGTLSNGEHKLIIDKIYPEVDWTGEFGTEEITFSVGKVEVDPNDQYEVIMTDDFENGGEGWIVTADDGSWQPANSGGGSRIMSGQAESGMGFTPTILYLCSRGVPGMNGTALYGSGEKKLTLKAKTYHLTFGAARWDAQGAARTLKVQIFPASAVQEDGTADESQMVAEESQAIVPDYKTSLDAVKFDVKFTADAEGDYVLKFIVGDASGAHGGYNDGVALGDVKVDYTPSVAGAEETRLLNEALAAAKETRDAADDERYAGKAFDALDAAIKTYEAEKDGYTAPSKYKEAAEDLTALTEAMKDHQKNCNDYDNNLDKAIELVERYGESKFNASPTYATLKEVAAKYEGKMLTDDAELAVAVTELSNIINLSELFFTEGKSAPENANGGKATGAAVFTERIRLGVEALKSLGVAEDDELIVAANNVLTDDDAVAEAIKTRITLLVYGQLKDPNNEMFKPELDEALEEVTPTYDMTVFVKNPNIYKQLPNMDFTDENVPGWIVPEGFNRPGLTIGWGSAKNVEGVAEDCMFQTWGGSYRVEQTIADLPAGVYTIQMGFGERMNDDEANFVDSYIYAKTTDSEEPVQVDVIGIGQAFPFAGGFGNMSIENVVVTDGILTIGANGGPSSHTFFNEVRVLLAAPANVDYSSLYEETVTGIEDTKTQTVRAIQLYDLNGNRITTARKGIVIVKKIMSDGSVRTEKVIKK